MSDLLPVDEALKRILDGVDLVSSETVELHDAADRVLAQPLKALRTQPPFPASAMDGYAVRASDVQTVPVNLTVIGESAAGHGFSGTVKAGNAVRIFTGAPVPKGADTIVIQEDVDRVSETEINVREGAPAGKYVRPAGLDFSEGDELIGAYEPMTPGSLSLAAAMNHAELTVFRKPRVALISSGDELLPPGSDLGPDQIIESNTYGVKALLERAGATCLDIGIAADTLEALEDAFSKADAFEPDVIVTSGGASVGDHDLVREALERRGVSLNFWKLAMRPGKPVMFGTGNRNGTTVRYIGLPGNPVSSLVCTTIFLVPLVREHLGLSTQTLRRTAILAEEIAPNDQREEYMRAVCERRDGKDYVTAAPSQDSSIIHLYQQANCLIIRPAFSPLMPKGSNVDIIDL